MPCSSSEGRRIGGIYRLHLQGKELFNPILCVCVCDRQPIWKFCFRFMEPGTCYYSRNDEQSVCWDCCLHTKGIVYWSCTHAGNRHTQLQTGWRRVAVVRIDDSDESIVSISSSVRQLLDTANVFPSSLITFTLKMQANDYPKHQFLQESHDVTSQKTIFFIVTAVKNSNLI
jgi:hypothetical protein